MARRSLRRIALPADIDRYLVESQDVPSLWSARHTIGLSSDWVDCIVEVGSGKGLFLIQSARARPATLCVGMEVSRKYAQYVAAQLSRRGLTNARIVHGDAKGLFHQSIPDQSLAEVHVYFPDPWWKKRHRGRRLMDPPFVQDVFRVLSPRGRFHFWTDVQEYFETTNAMIVASTRFAGPFAVMEEPYWHGMDFRTHFERRVRLNGLPVYRAEFEKPHAAERLGE